MKQSLHLFTPPLLCYSQPHFHIQHRPTPRPQKAHRCPNIPLDSLTVAAVLPGNEEMSSVIRCVREDEDRRPSSPRLPLMDQRLWLSWTRIRNKTVWFLMLKQKNFIILCLWTQIIGLVSSFIFTEANQFKSFVQTGTHVPLSRCPLSMKTQT